MMDDVAARGLVLLGCGKMGSAMLVGWLDRGLPAASVYVLDPYPSDWLRTTGVQINAGLPSDPAVALIAVKPQMMGDALPAMQALGNGKTLFVSIAAGTSIARFEAELGDCTAWDHGNHWQRLCNCCAYRAGGCVVVHCGAGGSFGQRGSD